MSKSFIFCAVWNGPLNLKCTLFVMDITKEINRNTNDKEMVCI